MMRNSDEEISDYRYFKYRRVDKRLIESLVSSQLYFSSPDALNDPFDCVIDVGKSVSRAIDSTNGARKEWLRSLLESEGGFIKDSGKMFGQLGICSFALDQLVTLMWSHYADEHRGVCLLYRFTPEFFLAPKNEIFGVDKVIYRPDALTDWLVKEAPTEVDEFVEKFVKIYLTAKSPLWSYEGEARVILKRHGLLQVPLGVLEQVCFGLRTPTSDVDLITKLASKYSGCKKFCRIVRGRGDFGIDAVEL